MPNFLSALPNWALALLFVALVAISALYVWILLNWLALRTRTRQFVARIRELETARDATESQLKVQDDDLKSARELVIRHENTISLLNHDGNLYARKLAEANRMLDLKQATIEEMQASMQAAQARATAMPVRVKPFSIPSLNAEADTNDATAEMTMTEDVAALPETKPEIPALPTPAQTAAMDELTALRYQIGDATAAVQARDIALYELKQQQRNMRTSLDMANDAVFARDKTIADLKAQLTVAAHSKSQTSPEELDAARSLIAGRDAKVAELEAQIGDLTQMLEDQRAHDESANYAIAEHVATISELNLQLDDLDVKLGTSKDEVTATANVQLAERTATISELNHEMDVLEGRVDDLRDKLADRDAQIETLTAQLSEAQGKLDAQNATVAEFVTDTQAEGETQGLLQRSLDNANAELTRVQHELDQERSFAASREARIKDIEAQTLANTQRLEDMQTTLATLSSPAPVLVDVPAAGAPATHERPAQTTAVTRDVARTEPIPLTSDDDAPDDKLTDIVGIGAVYAKRLRKEGIRTFRQLGRTPASTLAKIIQPAQWQTLDYDSWIEQAQELARHADETRARG